MADLIGQSLGRYHILEQLGEGGMAIVYKAYDTRLETNVAIKVIRTENLAPSLLERALKRFEREAKALAKLTHANIVTVLDYGEYQGKPYLVMPYLPGGTLKNQLTGRPVPWQQAIRILLPVARALAYAHDQGMIHRDVKPSNVLITESGDPMLTDFGIAKIIDDEATMDLTGTSAAVGTPEYMAPEQATARSVDRRADIYSLGIVFYELVTGRKPYQADTPMAVLIKQATEPLPRPTKYVPGLPENIERILIKALSKNIEDRYASMHELVRAMEAATQEKPDSQSVVAQPLPKQEPPAHTMDTQATRFQAKDDSRETVIEMPRKEAPLKEDMERARETKVPPARPFFLSKRMLWIAAGLIAVIVPGIVVINSMASSTEAARQAQYQWESMATAQQETAMAAEAATGTEQAQRDELATQTVVAKTATAHARLVEEWRAVEAQGRAVYGPEAGVLESKDDDYLELAYSGLQLKDFVISVEFQNPESASGDAWDYGFLLRDMGGNDQFRLVFDSSGSWSFDNVTPEPKFEQIASGWIEAFNSSPGTRNRIKVILRGTQGVFYVNGNLISELPLALRTQAGYIGLAIDTGGNEENGRKTPYSNWTIWELPAPGQTFTAPATEAPAGGASYQAVIVSGSTRFGPAPLHVTLYSEMRDENGNSVCQGWDCDQVRWTILKNGNEVGVVDSPVFVYDFSAGDYTIGLTICQNNVCATDWATVRATK